ncbi:DUF1349 domain-containing protein [bacterium]|nr:DUF1349 domain-containing protein [bacterium]
MIYSENSVTYPLVKSRALLVIVAALVHSVVFASDPAITKQSIEGWGNSIDPAGDCQFKVADGKLTITVPGSAKPHDLSPEMSSTTAPRVVRPVKGDFTIQVRVDGEFQPSGESTQTGRTGYTGAGLVVFVDDENFVRIERATLNLGGARAIPYTNFEIRVNGRLEQPGTTGDLPTESGKPTWLRLERRGKQIRGAMSHDGEHWQYGNPKELRAKAWDENSIVAGVAAISTSKQTFAPIYSHLTLHHDASDGADQK